MSTGPISRSPDLARLRDDGYEVEVRAGHLLVSHVPYLDAGGQVQFGTLASTLTLAGETTQRPDSHVTYFIGDAPCDTQGNVLNKIIIAGQHALGDGLVANFQFSSKPQQGYADYYENMTAYIRILAGYAAAVDPSATAQTFKPSVEAEGDSVFHFAETASSRAGIRTATEKLQLGKLAIVGLGGTGSYVLDLVAKTPVGEIHLFDGDEFLQHNAFRAPGAPSLVELEARPKKVVYFQEIYGKMRRGIFAHDYYVDESTVEELRDMDFVFLCLDRGDARKLIMDKLVEWNVGFIDVGMGVVEQDGALGGLLRVTASTPAKQDHLGARVPVGSIDIEDDYRKNIQVVDLNCLNAALAVVRWKKMVGFYADLEHEHHSVYAITGNALINEDQA